MGHWALQLPHLLHLPHPLHLPPKAGRIFSNKLHSERDIGITATLSLSNG